MVDGYNEKQRNIDRRLRLLCYITAKPYLKNQDTTVYEFMPVDGDPSPEELEAIENANLEKEMQKARVEYDRVKKEFQQWRVSQ